MRAEYLVRLDDACPTMNGQKWEAVENVLLRNSIKPIVAVVPANEDPDLVRGRVDERFWERARSWSHAGWMIAMHGYSHMLRPSGGGMVPLNRRSEFVGLPSAEQKRRIREGVLALQAQGLSPEAWVAPAHGLDQLTLEALRTVTGIRIISDSFALRPVRRLGFVWIPQQLWRPRVMPGGVWTICLHPNEMQSTDIERLSDFIAGHRDAFLDPHTAAARATPFTLRDMILETAFSSLLLMRKKLTQGSHNGRT